jgi:four helix bundle protein
MPQRQGVDERAEAFLRDVVVYIATILPVPGTRRVIEQLVAAAGSVAANRQEACAASSKRELIRYNEIALRSAKESVVWLGACRAGTWGRLSECERLHDEAGQLARILAAIVISAKGRGRP